MPTILRLEGFEFRIWTNDHEPPHVHVFKGDGQAKIEIESAEVVRLWNMRRQDVRRAEAIVNENRLIFLEAWRQIHGNEF